MSEGLSLRVTNPPRSNGLSTPLEGPRPGRYWVRGSQQGQFRQARAHQFSNELAESGSERLADVAQAAGLTSSYLTRLLRLTYLAPDITRAIIEVRHPRDLTGFPQTRPIHRGLAFETVMFWKSCGKTQYRRVSRRNTFCLISLPCLHEVELILKGVSLGLAWLFPGECAMRCLVIEDDADTASMIGDALREAGHVAVARFNALDALRLVKDETWDIVVLDRVLPGDIDGLYILHTMRKLGDTTPVIILSALDSLEERLRGLQGGADDYLTKPFAAVELLARIEALVRRFGSRRSRECGASS